MLGNKITKFFESQIKFEKNNIKRYNDTCEKKCFDKKVRIWNM